VKNTLRVLSRIFLVVILLYFFLVSIGLMAATFKGLGEGFAEGLVRTTSNPFVGLFIGILATSIVQSSSTTTSIVVGMVGSEVIAIGNAIPIIMGANIGTTVTNTLVSFGHVNRRDEFRLAIGAATVHDFFNIVCVCILFPLELATGFLEKFATLMSTLFQGFGGITFISPIKLATRPAINFIEQLLAEFLNMPQNAMHILMLIASLIFLFFSLFFLVRVMKYLVIKRAEAVLDNFLAKSAFTGILGGMIFTFIVQSSSITTSLLVPLVGAGILTIEAVFPVVVGANIGTTGTAILASLATGNIYGVTIAFVHFLFNLIGVLFIYPIKLFRIIPINLAKFLGNLAYKEKGYALVYVLGLFFVVPALLILISRYFE